MLLRNVTRRLSMRGVRGAATFALLLGLFSAETVSAQIDLIVRPADGSELSDVLERQGKTHDATMPDRFPEGVRSVHPLFTSAKMGKTDQRPFSAYVMSVADSAAFGAVSTYLETRADVVYVQPNRSYRIDALAAPDPFADSLLHIPVIGAQSAWTFTRGSKDVVVGLVDTGVFFQHPDLEGQFAVNAAEDLDADGILTDNDLNGIDDDGNGYVDDVSGYDFVDRPSTVEPGDFHGIDPDPHDDGSGHGTNVAGIISATNDNGIGMTGVAPGVRLAPIRAFGADGRGEDDDIARAIVFAAEWGVDVLNLSFGDTYISPLMHEAIRFAVDQGVTVVASAGNSGGDRPHYPSDYPEVISVVWLNDDGTAVAGRATYGVGVDIGAPGSSVFTTLMPGSGAEENVESLYGRRSGSSMAAPMVSAAAALIKSVRPNLKPAAIRSILTATARDIGPTGWDHRTGSGLLQVGTAVSQALPARVEMTSPDNDSGISGDVVEIRGSAIDPSFSSYEISYAMGDQDIEPGSWVSVAPASTSQVLNGVLAQWNVAPLAEGVYTLRLRVVLTTSRAVEVRHRVVIDRTPPQIIVRSLDDGLAGGLNAVIADIETDDLTSVTMQVQQTGSSSEVRSDRVARRHGLTFTDRGLEGGIIQVTVTAENRAGLRSSIDRSILVPASNLNTGAFSVEPTRIPEGFLLESFTDFDGDGLKEAVLNVYQDGWVGDTLAIYEWNGEFRRAASLLVGAFPRGTGDTDDDGLLELLTQVGPTTIVLEQDTGTYPSSLAFVDTSGLASSGESLWGARIFDLDGDGTDEIIGHDVTEWRILEWDGAQYVERGRLQNNTGVSDSEIDQNSFEQPQPLTGDLDADGNPDMLVGDSDGDWILFESAGDNIYREAWSYETTLYDAGARMASGDLDGDGVPEVVTYAHNWLTTTAGGLQQPDIGTYYLFESLGDDDLEVRDSILVAGEISQHGAVAFADFDGDGRDELVIVNPPDLYVLQFNDDLDWSVVYHSGPGDATDGGGVRSIKVVAGDVDMDGQDEALFAGLDGRMHLLQASGMDPAGTGTPAWLSATAKSELAVRLVWRADGFDSTWVYRATAGLPLGHVTTTTVNSTTDSVSVTSDYALRGWRDGVGGPLSRMMTVRPHAPGVVAAVRYPSSGRIEVAFTEPLAPTVTTANFRLSSGQHPSRVVLLRADHAADLQFSNTTSDADTLYWNELVDAEGTPLAQDRVPVLFTPASDATLIVSSWRLVSLSDVELTFSSPLDPTYALNPGNYSIRPQGIIQSVDWNADRPADVRLSIAEAAIGPTGLETVLEVADMVAADGTRLSADGVAIRLVRAADDLASVYAFPNPYDGSRHQQGLMIAGLPANARVQVFSSGGVPIRELTETQGTGGVRWKLIDNSGRTVPSGVYLIRVEADGMGAVLIKAAIIN